MPATSCRPALSRSTKAGLLQDRQLTPDRRAALLITSVNRS
jgi:hypothetical protein